MTKGQKTGGRQKGTPNKRTQNLVELIEASHGDFDPVLELINIYKDTKTPLELKTSILKDLMPYIYPKRKAIEFEPFETSKPLNIVVKTMQAK